MFVILITFAVLGIAAQQPRANTWVQGVVYEKAAAIRPFRGVFVSLWSSGGELLGTARTDAQGRYQFLDLPQGRLTVTASKPGYLTRRAAGRAGSSAIVDCSSGCRQPNLDFELSRGAVVAGLVLDGLREPVSRAAVSVHRDGAAASSEKPSTAATDDRGRFRMAGLEAGKYTLTVRRRTASGPDEIAVKTLDVRDGEQIGDLALMLGSLGSFGVGGRVSGIPYGEGYRTWVTLQPLNGAGRSIQATVGPDGRFRFESVPAGRYRASAAAVKLGAVERTDHFLESVEVLGETDSITLQRVEPATVTGSVEIAAGALPAAAVIRFTSNDGFGFNWTRVRAADRQFKLSGMRPGSYRVEADSKEIYVKGVRVGDKMASSEEVMLAPGPNQFTVIVAADHGQVFGMVRDPQTRQPAPHALVALQGEGGKYSVQADQTGRFLFGKVIPGDYRICAWTNLAPERVEDAASWERAGCQSRIIPIEPSREIEIDLRAAP